MGAAQCQKEVSKQVDYIDKEQALLVKRALPQLLRCFLFLLIELQEFFMLLHDHLNSNSYS